MSKKHSIVIECEGAINLTGLDFMPIGEEGAKLTVRRNDKMKTPLLRYNFPPGAPCFWSVTERSGFIIQGPKK